jgi:hypothetical protein
MTGGKTESTGQEQAQCQFREHKEYKYKFLSNQTLSSDRVLLMHKRAKRTSAKQLCEFSISFEFS